MQLTSVATNVKHSNIGQITVCKMEANPYAYRMMMDGMYQNKRGSMVREICCNASDSHTQAGKRDVPFIVHLPTSFEPYFGVTDKGVGLDDNGVRKTIATFFHSTKREDNEVVGAFGLGSKTPFAYTDAFTINAVKDGRKRQFSAFIGEDGYPSIANMGGEFSEMYWQLDDNGNPVLEIEDQWDTTDEENGVQIIVPVTNSDDFAIFAKEVRDQLAFFDVKPIIENGEVVWTDWTNVSSFMDLGDILIADSSKHNVFNGFWVVQGPVGYKADLSMLKAEMSDENKEFLDIIGAAAILRFKLGDIAVTPSRENLQYSEKTIAAISALLDNARVNIKAKVQAQIDALGDQWQTATGINSNNMLRRLAAITRCGFEAEGYYRTGQYYHLDLERIANLEGRVALPEMVPQEGLGFDAKWDEQEGETAPIDSEDEEEDNVDEDAPEHTLADSLNLQFKTQVWERKGRRSRGWKAGPAGRNARADITFRVLVRDTEHKPTLRQKLWLKDATSGQQVFILQNRFGGPVSPEQLAAIKSRIGASWNPSLMSEVELPERHRPKPRKKSERTDYTMPTGYVYSPHGNQTSTKEWARSTEKLKDTGAYYVIVHRHEIAYSKDAGLVFRMANSGLLDKPIMAIRQRDVAKIAGNPDWILVSDKAEEIIQNVKDNVTLQNGRRLQDCRHVSIRAIDNSVINVLQTAIKDGKLGKGSPLARLLRINAVLDKAKARARKRGFNSIVAEALSCGGYVVDDTLENAIDAREAKLTKTVAATYPLLPFLKSASINGEWRGLGDVAESVVAYAQSVGA